MHPLELAALICSLTEKIAQGDESAADQMAQLRPYIEADVDLESSY